MLADLLSWTVMDEMKAGEGGGGKLGKEDYTQLRETSSRTRTH